jgi:hypothetical protein
MKPQGVMRRAAAGLVLASGWGCGVIGPTCIARQERGTVATLQGQVSAGQIVSHLVRYETQGSQNDGNLTWDGQYSAEAPRIRFFATRAACTNFQQPPAANTGDCAPLASAGWTTLGPASTLIVTHGRGNPEVLGATPEYKIWVVGDSERSAHYAITITWFFGPDC